MQHTPSDTQTHSLALMDPTIPPYVVSPLHFAWRRLLIFFRRGAYGADGCEFKVS